MEWVWIRTLNLKFVPETTFKRVYDEVAACVAACVTAAAARRTRLPRASRLKQRGYSKIFNETYS